jgi:starvation-inducible DNA-binding protein
VLFIAQIGLVFGLSAAIGRLAPLAASVLLVVYAALNGLTLSAILLVYTQTSIAQAFLATAATFGVMSVYGYTTRRDLSTAGNLLVMALTGFFIGSIINAFWANSALYWVLTYLGIAVFIGLTAWDTQQIKLMIQQAPDDTAARRVAIKGGNRMTTHQNTATSERARGSQPQLYQHGPIIQEFGTLRLLPIALSYEARLQSGQLLNQILADTLLLYSLYKKCHWQMRGPTFEQLHLLLDKHAGEQLALIDTLAERVQMLGGVAIADPRYVAEVTTIERAPDGVEEVPAMLARLLSAHETIIIEVRAAIEQTAQNGDSGSNDLLVGDILRSHEQQVWGVAEHLVDTPLVRA